MVVVHVFRQMRMIAHAVTARHCNALTHHALANRERGTGGIVDPHHGKRIGVVKLLDQLLGVRQDIVFIFDDVVGRKPALALPDGEAAACQVKTYPDFLGCLDFGFELHVVDLEVAVVHVGRAARKQ